MSTVADHEIAEGGADGDAKRRSFGQLLLRRRSSVPHEDATADEQLIPEPLGPVLQESWRKARKGHYGPRAQPIPGTTYQAEILNPVIVGPPTDDEGVLCGIDMLSKLPVAHDPFVAYSKKIITSPHVAVAGVIGSAKSALIKTCYVIRPLILRNRRVVVMDKKDMDGEGEYSPLVRKYGGTPLGMKIGSDHHGTVLNVLDPVILQGSGFAAQSLLVRTFAQTAMNTPMTPRQIKAVGLAHRRALRRAEVDGRIPCLDDLVRQIGLFDKSEVVDESPAARELLHQEGMEVRYMMEQVILEELEGLFDGHTSSNVQLHPRLTSFDVSQLPEEGPAVALVMALANTWLMGMLRTQRGRQTSFIIEEGWHLANGPAGELIRSNSKLARGLGLSNVAAFHHPGDMPPGSPGEAMLREAQTVHLFRQDRDDDIEKTSQIFGLAPGSRELLGNLRQGHHLLKIGNRREIHVKHVRSQLEIQLTDTDAAMLGKAGN